MLEDEFKTNDFYISYHGVDLIKNGIKKEHFDFIDLHSIVVEKGRSVKYWPIAFLLGLFLTVVFLWKIIKVTPNLDISEIGYNRTIIGIYVSFYILLFLGLAIAYTAIKRTTIMKVILRNNKTYTWPLSKIIKDKQLNSLLHFLSSRTNLVSSLNKLEKVE